MHSCLWSLLGQGQSPLTTETSHLQAESQSNWSQGPPTRHSDVQVRQTNHSVLKACRVENLKPRWGSAVLLFNSNFWGTFLTVLSLVMLKCVKVPYKNVFFILSY